MTPSPFFAPMRPIWERMHADTHPWLAIIKGNATANRYSDHGRWAALQYAITDDASMAQLAWEKWKGSSPLPLVLTVADSIREWFIEWCLLYDVLRPYLDTIGQTAGVAGVLRATAENVLKGTLPSDSDQTAASYLGLAMADAVLAHDPAHQPFLERLWKHPGTGAWIPVGGLTATGADTATIRNTLSLYATMADGGNWIESSMYDNGTTWLIDMGTTFLTNVHGTDYFPEFTAFRDAHRRQFLHVWHSSLKDTFQYGDDQQPNMVREIDWESVFCALGHLPGDENLKAAIRGCEASVRATNNWPLQTGTYPAYARYFYFSDPYQGANDQWRGTAQAAHHSRGQGHVYSGRADTALHFTFATLREPMQVDHFPPIYGDLQVVKGADRAVYHPIGYAAEERAYNQATIMNRCGSCESTETVAFDEGDDYLYAAGVSAGCGPDIFNGYYDPPLAYLHELGRAFVRLGDVIIVHDRLHADNPYEQPHGTSGARAISRYYLAAQARMAKRRGLKSVYWHAPVAPTLSASGLSWTVGDTPVTIKAISPPDLVAQIVDTSVAEFGMKGNIYPTQLKWAGVFTPPDRPFDSIVWGIDLTGVATFEPFESGDLTGVTVTRQGQPDALVAFSKKPGPKVLNSFVLGKLTYDRTKAQTVFTSRLLNSAEVPAFDVRAGTRVYLADLAAGTTVLVNGVASTSTTPEVLFAATATGVEAPPASAQDLVKQLQVLLEQLAGVLAEP